MTDEEFVKLRFWLDAELTMIRVMLAIIIGFEVHKKLVWAGVIAYVIFALIYAAMRIQYVERKHMGYVRLPKR